MSIIKCNECNNDVSDKAAACPKCGAPINEPEEDGFKIAVDQRDKEIELVWKRSNLFWLFTAGAFVAFYSIKENPVYSVLIANIGLFCSLCWTLVNRGSKFWMNSWEKWVGGYDPHVVFLLKGYWQNIYGILMAPLMCGSQYIPILLNHTASRSTGLKIFNMER